MRSKQWDKNGNMVIETGHKAFDRQSVCIATGNVIAPTQLSFHVRPKHETECNGFTREPGHLRNYDLGHWDNMPNWVRDFVIEVTDDPASKGVRVYEFFHVGTTLSGTWRRYRVPARIIHGYVITDYEGNLLRTFYVGPTYKSWRVVDVCAEYVSDGVP